MGLLMMGLASNLFAMDLKRFQLNHKIQSEARVFLLSEGRHVIRLSSELKADDLAKRGAGVEPISSFELLLNANGQIQSFAVHRFNESVVFDVRPEDRAIKFVKKEAETALFSGAMSTYRAQMMSTREALKFLYEAGGAPERVINQRILKTLNIPDSKSFSSAEFIASRDDFLDLLDEDVAVNKKTDAKAFNELSSQEGDLGAAKGILPESSGPALSTSLQNPAPLANSDVFDDEFAITAPPIN